MPGDAVQQRVDIADEASVVLQQVLVHHGGQTGPRWGADCEVPPPTTTWSLQHDRHAGERIGHGGDIRRHSLAGVAFGAPTAARGSALPGRHVDNFETPPPVPWDMRDVEPGLLEPPMSLFRARWRVRRLDTAVISGSEADGVGGRRSVHWAVTTSLVADGIPCRRGHPLALNAVVPCGTWAVRSADRTGAGLRR